MTAARELAPDEAFMVECFFCQYSNHWEALCVDFDLAVQGSSYDEVFDRMVKAVSEYLKYVATLPEGERAQFLKRQVPMHIRLGYIARVLWMALRARAGRGRGGSGIFTVPSHA